MSITKGEWEAVNPKMGCCKVWTDKQKVADVYPYNEEGFDNARLIAAVPNMLKACEAWMKVESEMLSNNPCPNLVLRAQYRKQAVELTEAAIAKAKKE